MWAMHGEAWWEPRNFSLVKQPFLISPAINVGDVAVALKRRPGSRLEDAMRDAHPFPIFERFVKEDVYVCLLYTSPSPRDRQKSRMPSSA